MERNFDGYERGICVCDLFQASSSESYAQREQDMQVSFHVGDGGLEIINVERQMR